MLIAGDAGGGPVGFAELSIRPWAEGCRTRRVAYFEGWFGAPEARRRGVGRRLVEVKPGKRSRRAVRRSDA